MADAPGYNMGRNASGRGTGGSYSGQALRDHLAQGPRPVRPVATTRDRLNAISQESLGTNVPTSTTAVGRAADFVADNLPQLNAVSRVAQRINSLPTAAGRGWWTRQEQKLSGEGMDTLYARGGSPTQHPIRTSNFHMQGSGDRFAQNQHLVSERVDPTIAQESFQPAPGPFRPNREVMGPMASYGPPAPAVVDMRGPAAATDFLHRQNTAGSGGNMWLGDDAQHATMTMGIDGPTVRPIRRVMD